MSGNVPPDKLAAIDQANAEAAEDVARLVQLARQLTADLGRTQADFQIAAAIDPLGEYHAKWLLNAAIMVMADAAGPPEEVPDATPDDAG